MKKKSKVTEQRLGIGEPEIIGGHVAAGCKIYRFSTVKNSTLADRCVVGDFTRITDSELGSDVQIDRFSLLYKSSIGAYSYTGPYDMVFHATIGRFCAIAWGVTIGPSEHDYRRLTMHDFVYNDRYGLKPPGEPVAYDRFSKKMEIGHDVWIGANATILRGVKIGNGAVIGANAVVTKDVAPYAIVAGCPARLIRYRFPKRRIRELEELAWWNWPADQIRKHYHLFSSDNAAAAVTQLVRQKKPRTS